MGNDRVYDDGTRPTDKAHGGVRVDYNGAAARLRIDPEQNVIIGAKNIMAYVGIKSFSTLWRWVELFAFPAIKRPDGLWMTTMTAIDQWIFLAAETANDSLEKSRGNNVTAQIALERLQRHVDDGTFDREHRRIGLKTAKAVGLIDPDKNIRARQI